MIGALVRRGEDPETHREEGCVKMEVEMRVMESQTMVCLGFLSLQRERGLLTS